MKIKLNTDYWDCVELDTWKNRNINTAYIYTVPIIIWFIIAGVEKDYIIMILCSFFLIGTILRHISYNKYKAHQREKV